MSSLSNSVKTNEVCAGDAGFSSSVLNGQRLGTTDFFRSLALAL
jgi:hypothetical protein